MDELRIGVLGADGSSRYTAAPDSLATLVFGHGSGADMRHSSMHSIADAFASEGLSTLRFNFPFKEAGRSRVDSKEVSTATIAAALEFAKQRWEGPHYLGGHSFGGRMAMHAVVDRDLEVDGMIFGSFPLHPAGKPSVTRAEHLDEAEVSMLFLSGTRDALAQSELLAEATDRVGARLKWLDTGDHGYKTLKRSREDDIFSEMASYALEFVLETSA